MIDQSIIDHARIDEFNTYDPAKHKTRLGLRFEKKEYRQALRSNVSVISELQEKMYAQHKHSILLVFQAMDAAGKDSTIERVVTGVNPQGVEVNSFKKPTDLELAHDFLWRVNAKLPPKGKIGVFNRSHYEEVLVTRVHPEFIVYQNLPSISTVDQIDEQFWQNRFASIRNFENHIAANGTTVVKFFLNVSKDEQRSRLEARMAEPEKHWKFNVNDIEEREHWGEYQNAFTEAINNTSSSQAPWYVIPADNKRVMRIMVTQIVRDLMEKMSIEWPNSGRDIEADMAEARALLAAE
ncbi:MAG: polyphosphate kinase 2 family protein [Flavobacteriales bacterium]|nr:polyphosphate kinase 2 family protein [Flavobacteriales bacterium]